MSIRIIDVETERLILEMAKLELVTPSQAVHKAVSQWLSELNLTSREEEVVREIVAKRETIASIYTADDVVDGFIEDAGGPLLFIFLGLVAALVFSDLRRTAVVITLIVLVTAVVWIERRMSRKRSVREKVRCSLQKEIDAIKPLLPIELNFLSEQVERSLVWYLVLPDDRK